MKPHELLRQAALILTAGWSKGADARDDADRMSITASMRT
jgi:hypothetical protein